MSMRGRLVRGRATVAVPVGTASSSILAPGGRKAAKLRQEGILLAALALTIIVFGVVNAHFLSRFNLVSTAQDSTEVALLAIGELYVIVTAGIDLSVGAILGLAGVVGAMAAGNLSANPVLALIVGAAVAIGIGIVCGVINGLMIVRLRITPFVATLAMLGVATGITLVLTSGVDVGGLPALASSVGNHIFLDVLTMPIVVTIVLAIVFGLILQGGVFGRWTYAIGSDMRAARQSGISVRRHLVKVYMISGLLAGIAGFVVMTRLGVGSPVEGANDELSAITAVVIGGASLFGGRGSMVGTIIGSVLLSVLLSGLIISGVQPYWQTVVTGLMLAVAVVLQTIGRRGGREEAM
jgi:ribose transport system permease protein